MLFCSILYKLTSKQFIYTYYKTMNSTTLQQTTPSSPIRLPKTSNETFEERPLNNTLEKYQLQTTQHIFDPTIINTPPNEFMNNLKQRISVYYATSNK